MSGMVKYMVEVCIRNNECTTFALIINQEKVGSCYTYPSLYVSNAVELWAFGVRGESRGRGYGQQMLQEVIKYYKTQTIVLFVDKHNERALHIYQKAGFKIVGEYRGGKYAWEMRLER